MFSKFLVLIVQGPSSVLHVRYSDLWQYNLGPYGRLSQRLTVLLIYFSIFLAEYAGSQQRFAGAVLRPVAVQSRA
jgi:hypothetical protein